MIKNIEDLDFSHITKEAAEAWMAGFDYAMKHPEEFAAAPTPTVLRCGGPPRELREEPQEQLTNA